MTALRGGSSGGGLGTRAVTLLQPRPRRPSGRLRGAGRASRSPMAMKLVEMKLSEVDNRGQELLERYFPKE